MSRESIYYHYLFYFIIYFFANNLFLPQGLLYTTLLMPVFIFWLYKTARLKSMLKWSVLLLIPVPFQVFGHIDLPSYLISSMMVAATWVFLFTSLEAVKMTRDDLADIFYKVLLVNSLLVLTALLTLPFSPLRDIIWNSEPMSPSLPAIPRLKILAYEPSHYALLMSPVFLYFLLRVTTGQSRHPLLLSVAAGIPLILSFSFGVIGALFIASLTGMFIFFNKLSRNSKRVFIFSLSFIVLILVTGWFLWPGNPMFLRIENIFTGADTSAKGRLYHSFMFSWDLIRQHNLFTGVGPGQVKILAHDLIINYYQYTGEFAEVVRIPNSMGEILAVYGIYGFVFKIVFEMYFFFRLKIYRNLYTLTLFLFIFIYQFTGSFLINAAEIGVWAIVFNSRFSSFDLDRINSVSE